MVDYDSSLNMPYNAWISRQAALDNIPVNELEKKLEVVPIRVEGENFLFGCARHKAIKKFNKEVKDYLAVTDFKEVCGIRGLVLGYSIANEYVISGTAIRRKENCE